MVTPSPLVDRARSAIRDGDLGQAEALAQRALTEDQDPAAHALLVPLLRRRGEMAEAERHARAALDAAPGDAVTWAQLGALLWTRDDAAGALDAYATAAAVRPENAILQNEYANALTRAGQFDAAVERFECAVSLRSDIPEIHNNMGNALRGAGRLRDAADAYVKALRLRPAYPEALGNLGVLLQGTGDQEAAISVFDRAIALRPEDALAHTHRGAALGALGRLTEAAEAHRTALAIAPKLASAHNNLGIVLKDQGLLAEARDAYRAAMAVQPNDAAAHSNFLMCLSYDPAIDGETLLAQHRAWAARHETAPVAPAPEIDLGEGPLRIGYISPDFWTHSVAYFIEPVLAAHDPGAVHVTCFSDVTEPDATTERLRGLPACWRDVAAMDDAALCRQIRDDGIQVLVDLSGHTGGNRLRLFGRRAAPVQVTWIGYPATTGLASMDYRVTDAWADPPGETDRFHSERLVRLPGGFLCYRPPAEAPDPVGGLLDRPLTFGSFNNLSKVTEEAIAVWSAILSRAPGSRLLLKSRQLADAGVRDRILGVFGQHGIGAERLLLHARLPDRRDHLSLYDDVDVALDTFPYNGTTTTVEALWMGVPVVTLAGRLHAGRVGVSLLQQIGREAWIGETPADYVEIALRLAEVRPTRSNLRAWLAASRLTDADAFTREWEKALAGMVASGTSALK